MISQDFPLSNGDILRIATTPIQLGDGGNLSSSGIKPDIMVNVSKADQRLYYADPFKELTIASNSDGARTNSPNGATRIRRPRFNEAELVRERRDGIVADSESGGAGEGEDKPVVRDPVLGRALDFLKGLKLVRPARG
jgi:C-terminal processing protease CtpA/Prc